MNPMKLIQVILWLLFFSACSPDNEEYADRKGVSKFWLIQRSLEKGEEPSSRLWKELFSTPYFGYLSQSKTEQGIMETFRIAFHPERRDECDSLTMIGNYDSRVLSHLKHIPAKRVNINDYLDSLMNLNFMENSLIKTSYYLPENYIEHNQHLKPKIAFGIYEPDGMASDKMIAIDVAFATSIDFDLFLAHELHHFFLGNLRRDMRKGESDSDEYLLMTIRQLHYEGIADLIDKKGILEIKEVEESENWYAYHYNRHYDNARNTFSKIDTMLSSGGKVGKAVWNSLHFGTHPEALHMAKLIEDELGKEGIMSVLDNPFDFIRAYQEAAIINPQKGSVFSSETLERFNQLEARYLIKVQ